MGTGSLVSSLGKTLQEFKGTAMNITIAALTIALEEILNRAVYHCPCVQPSEIICDRPTSSDSANPSRSCTPMLNYAYGVSYIAAPAIALFIIMAASSPKLWKTWTGCYNKSQPTRRPKKMICWTLIEIFGRALIAPVTWVGFALLDGKYFACAVTPLPYDVGGKTYPTCNKIPTSQPPMSDAFNDNRSYSQLIGWSFIAGIALVGFSLYAVSRCCYPLTYYHSKYYHLYQQFEESEFDDEMKAQAQKEAESNIRKFMGTPRDKTTWDRISTVFSFHRNPKNKALYSYLHEFILEQEKEKPLLEINDGAPGDEVVHTETTVTSSTV